MVLAVATESGTGKIDEVLASRESMEQSRKRDFRLAAHDNVGARGERPFGIGRRVRSSGYRHEAGSVPGAHFIEQSPHFSELRRHHRQSKDDRLGPVEADGHGSLDICRAPGESDRPPRQLRVDVQGSRKGIHAEAIEPVIEKDQGKAAGGCCHSRHNRRQAAPVPVRSSCEVRVSGLPSFLPFN
jgi:hypothetical protein